MTAGREDRVTGRLGRLRAARADREQAIDVSDEDKLPTLPPRESDRESVERPEKRGWPLELVLWIADLIGELISAWH